MPLCFLFYPLGESTIVERLSFACVAFNNTHIQYTNTHTRRTFVKDEEYALMLDNITKACADFLLVNKCTGEVLIGKRNVQPQPDWWFCGGRVFPGI